MLLYISISSETKREPTIHSESTHIPLLVASGETGFHSFGEHKKTLDATVRIEPGLTEECVTARLL